MNHRRRYALLHGDCSSSGVQAEGRSVMLSLPRGHGGLAKQVMDEVVSIVHAPATRTVSWCVRLYADARGAYPRN